MEAGSFSQRNEFIPCDVKEGEPETVSRVSHVLEESGEKPSREIELPVQKSEMKNMKKVPVAEQEGWRDMRLAGQDS